MTHFTFESHRLRRGQQTFDGETPVGEVYQYQPWRERLSLSERPTRYVAKLPSGRWLPGLFRARHDAAESLRAYCRVEQYEEQPSKV